MKKKIYETPEVEILDCRVEKGFAGSVGAENLSWDGQMYDDGQGGETDELMFN